MANEKENTTSEVKDNETENKQKDAQAVFNLAIVRRLCRDFQDRIVDVRPDRTDPERKKLVHYFENTEQFQRDFEIVKREREIERAKRIAKQQEKPEMED